MEQIRTKTLDVAPAATDDEIIQTAEDIVRDLAWLAARADYLSQHHPEQSDYGIARMLATENGIGMFTARQAMDTLKAAAGTTTTLQ